MLHAVYTNIIQLLKLSHSLPAYQYIMLGIQPKIKHISCVLATT